MQLTRNQFIVLRALEVPGAMRGGDLVVATAAAISASSMYDAVNDLERDGFLKVDYDITGKRPVRYLTITHEGRQALHSEIQAYESIGTSRSY